MATSRDYNELLETWKGWRDAVGPEIRKSYPEVCHTFDSFLV